MMYRCKLWVAAVVALLALWGCEEQIAVNPFEPQPQQPSGDRFGIFLAAFTGPTHRQQAQAYLSAVRRQTGWPELYVETDDRTSRVFRGEYPTYIAAEDDLRRVKAFRDAAGRPLFRGAIIMPLKPRPYGPPEWDLRNCAGPYSVLVAVFYNVPEANPPYMGREKFAVDYCRQLRARGEEAFYYHGTTRSIVTVGSFQESALAKIQKDGQELYEIRDPQIQQIIDRYKYLAVNGRQEFTKVLNRSTGRYDRIPQKPRVISVPRRRQGGVPGSFDRPGNAQLWQGP